MKIKELFSQLSNQKIFFLRNIGNRGDALINEGTNYLLNQYNIQSIDVWYPDNVLGQVLLVSGGGHFSSVHSHMAEILPFYINKFKKIYVLPSSFDATNQKVCNLLKKIDQKVTLFCRESYSYEQVRKVCAHDQVFVDHDMALNFRWDKLKKKGKGVLNAFRTDGERKMKISIPKNNSDISLDPNELFGRKLYHRTRMLGPFLRNKICSFLSKQRCAEFINSISQYEEVNTDRAHVAIAAAMLGKKTNIYPNNYHKVKGICEFSLSELSNVRFIEK